MNSKERLMIVAMEECAEVQQEISKALRFGVNNYHCDNPDITNGERILKEYYQLKAVMDMLVIQRIIPTITEEEKYRIYNDKVEAVEKWEQYSKQVEENKK